MGLVAEQRFISVVLVLVPIKHVGVDEQPVHVFAEQSIVGQFDFVQFVVFGVSSYPLHSAFGRPRAHIGEKVMSDRQGPVEYLNVNVASTGSNVLVPNPPAGTSVILINANLIVTAAVVVTFEDNDGIDRIGPHSYAANGGISMPEAPLLGHTKTASGQGLSLRLSANVQVGGSIVYRLTPT